MTGGQRNGLVPMSVRDVTKSLIELAAVELVFVVVYLIILLPLPEVVLTPLSIAAVFIIPGLAYAPVLSPRTGWGTGRRAVATVAQSLRLSSSSVSSSIFCRSV